jgi:replicative DNA helicase
VSGARSLLDAFERADELLQSGLSATAATWPTGFVPLDECLGGGLRAGELTLLGGAPGLGKTTFALQVARNVAAAGQHVLYVCYEHREQDLLERLLGMELGLQGDEEGLDLGRLRAVFAGDGGVDGLVERLTGCPGGVQALEALSSYASRLALAVVAGQRTGLDELRSLVLDAAVDRPLVVVDYLQKVRAPGETSDADDRVTLVAEGLKDLALEADLPLLAIVAADKAGVDGGRTRLRHLRGSTALAYEADVALILNDKYSIVARHHLMYGTTNAEQYRKWAVCSVEKNRSGRDDVDLEFRKHFERGHFSPYGQRVAEQLVDERVHRE